MVETLNETLVGKYFLSFEDGKLALRGKVLSEVSDDLYLVETYDWVDGQTFDMRLVNIKDMGGWRFYQTSEDMKSHSEVHARRFFQGEGVNGEEI